MEKWPKTGKKWVPQGKKRTILILFESQMTKKRDQKGPKFTVLVGELSTDIRGCIWGISIGKRPKMGKKWVPWRKKRIILTPNDQKWDQKGFKCMVLVGGLSIVLRGCIWSINSGKVAENRSLGGKNLPFWPYLSPKWSKMGPERVQTYDPIPMQPMVTWDWPSGLH